MSRSARHGHVPILVYNGVDPDRLLLEEQSTSTVENIAFSKVVIERHRSAQKSGKGRPPKALGSEGPPR